MVNRLEVVMVDPLALQANAYNPNRQSDSEFELLLRSMEEDGFTQPVLAQKGTNVIIDGEHRWRAAKILGLEKIPVVYVEMSADQMRIATLRHNRARGSEDMRYVADVFRQMEELGGLEWAKDSLMLDDADVERLLQLPTIEEMVPETVLVARAENDGSVMGVNREREAERAAEQQEVLQTRAQQAVDRQVYNINLWFTLEEGEKIKRVMGQRKPLDWLVEMMDKYGG